MLSYRKSGDGFGDRLDNKTLCGEVSGDTTSLILTIFGSLLTVLYGIIVLSFLYKFALSTYYRMKMRWDNRRESPGESSQIRGRFLFVAEIVWTVMGNFELLFNVTGLIMALLGCIMHPLFFTFHILTVAFRSKRLLNVLKAIMGPVTGILLTLLLFIVLQYLFAVIAYVSFPDDYLNYTCDSLLHCFLYDIDQTFKANGGFAATLQPTYTVNANTNDVSIKYYRIVYDFLTGFLLVIVVMQLLSGQIIDEFKSLRDEAQKIEADISSSCIICSEKVEDIERKSGKTFAYHMCYVHNAWFYLMFIGYLMQKPKLDFSGIESYVHNCVKAENIGWLPYSLYTSLGYSPR